MLEFSLTLIGLQEKIKQQLPAMILNIGVLTRDQCAEFVLDPALCHRLKQLVCREPSCNFCLCIVKLLGGKGCWGVRPLSQSLLFTCRVQFGSIWGTIRVFWVRE